MSPIAAGTLCLIVQHPDGGVPPYMLGRIVSTFGRTGDACAACGADMYTIRLDELIDYTCRAVLRPILPPGVEVSEPRDEQVPEIAA